MSILIIGAGSVIGKAMAARLSDEKEVSFAGRRDADIPFDLTEWRTLPDIHQAFETVVHVAADFGGESDHDWARAEAVNAVGTLSACALARRAQAKHVVLMSSLSATYRPGDPYYGVYALSKRHGEEIAQSYCAAHGLALTILRPSQIYDDQGLCRPHQSLFYMMADRAQADEEIALYGSHDARRNYLHIDDLSELAWRIIQQRCTGVFTCAHPQSVTLSEMAKAAFSAFGRTREARFLPEKPALPDLPEISDYAVYDRVGYHPRINIWEGYRRIRDYREKHT